MRWREYFDVVVTSSDVEASKPIPYQVVVALERLGLLTEQCLFTEDTIYNHKASLQAGVSTVRVGTRPFPETADERLTEEGRGRLRKYSKNFDDL